MPPLSQVYVDTAVIDLPETRRILERMGIAPVAVDTPAPVFEAARQHPDSIGAGKRLLYLTRNRGSFVKHCPGTRHYTCCGYRILHFAAYCTMDCSYCILQTYFHPPVLQYFVNIDPLRAELAALFAKGRIARIGTGEFTDSLIWERTTGIGRRLVKRFAGQTSAVLELKSKSVDIAGLEGIDHARKTIVSWSLNTPRVIASEERRTASLEARLSAAARCVQWGYPVAFHFDPMFLYDGCEAEYRDVVRRLFAAVPPEKVVWISLGTFRFMPALKPIIQDRFPDSKIVYGELVTGLDEKMRYFKPLRIEFYRKMVSWIRQAGGHVGVYFCMEDEEVWQRAAGVSPESEGGLERMLDRWAQHHCSLKEG